MVPASGKVLITLTALLGNNTVNATAQMSFQTDSVAIVAATLDTTSLMQISSTANASIQASATYVLTDLSPGSHTFTAKYRRNINGGTATFANRSIIVTPLP
jgi:hypothetical protein